MEETTSNIVEAVPESLNIKMNHKPEVLMGLGIAGLLFSIGWGIGATVKAVRKCDNIKVAEGKEKLTKKEILKATWKYYLPMALSATLSVPAIIAGNRISSKRAAAFAAAYGLSETALAQYQNKVKEFVGESKEKEIKQAAAIEQAKATPVPAGSTVLVSEEEEQLFFEPLSGRYFKSTWNKICKACNRINERCLAGNIGAYSMNDWFEEIGLPSTDAGEMLGWCTTTFGGNRGLLDIDMGAGIKDDKPCCTIIYKTRPYYVAEYMR